ncbi:hypothetical protein FHG87_011552, partial [Trinorchestia longiramus]
DISSAPCTPDSPNCSIPPHAQAPPNTCSPQSDSSSPVSPQQNCSPTRILGGRSHFSSHKNSSYRPLQERQLLNSTMVPIDERSCLESDVINEASGCAVHGRTGGRDFQSLKKKGKDRSKIPPVLKMIMAGRRSATFHRKNASGFYQITSSPVPRRQSKFQQSPAQSYTSEIPSPRSSPRCGAVRTPDLRTNLSPSNRTHSRGSGSVSIVQPNSTLGGRPSSRASSVSVISPCSSASSTPRLGRSKSAASGMLEATGSPVLHPRWRSSCSPIPSHSLQWPLLSDSKSCFVDACCGSLKR